jgi:hypothetical protein
MVYTYVTNGIPIDFNYIRKELIRLDKLKEYQSWLDKTYLGIYQNRAYLLLFITFMIRKIFARRGVDRFDLVNIHNEKLRLAFGGNHRLIKNIITILTAAEVIRKNPVYSAGEFSQSYGLPLRFRGQKLGHTALPDVDTSFYNAGKMMRRTLLKIEDDPTTTDAIISNIKKTRLDPSINDFANSYAYASTESRDSNLIWLGNNYPMLGADIKDNRREFDLLRFEYHSHIGRIFHNFTNSPKIYRSYLRYRGRRLVQLDIKSAHPFLLLNWYQNFDKTWDDYDAVLRVNPFVAEDLDEEVKRYREHVASEDAGRDFYLWARNQDELKNEGGDASDRGAIKKKFYKFLYGPAVSNCLIRDVSQRRQQCPFTDLFDKYFPILLRIIEWHKTRQFYSDDSPQMKRIRTKLRSENSYRMRKNKPKLKLSGKLYKQFSYANQCLEGEAMVRGVCHDLAREDGFFFIPIHDAIICQPSKEKIVRNLMLEHWRRHVRHPSDETIGFAPVIVTTKL